MDMMEEVMEEAATLVLVDVNDNVVGSAAPEDVGSKLHRTASLYLFDSETESLLVSKQTSTIMNASASANTSNSHTAATRTSNVRLKQNFFNCMNAFVLC